MVIKVTDSIGWVYESNRTKQKKAQKDLDSFYREDRINDLGKTKDAEVDDIQKKIDAWDKYLEQLDWDYKEYERMENERILKELMGATSEAQIRAWITADMEKFNSDIATNYQNYNTIFQDNLLTPYKEANIQLAALRRERLALLDVSDVLGKNDGMVDELKPDKYVPNMKDFGDLQDNVDYAKLMVNAKTQEEFNKWAKYREEKMLRHNMDLNGSQMRFDGSGKQIRYKSNEEIEKEWKKKGNKATGAEYWGNNTYSTGIEQGPVTYTGLAMLHGSVSKPEYVLNSDQAYNLLRNMATTRLPEMKRTGTDSNCGTQYIVQGDVVLEGVNDPAKFWSGVTTAMGSRWNVTKKIKG